MTPGEEPRKSAAIAKDEKADSSFCRRSLVIGLTGGIATGKSTVAEMFRDLGAQVISADAIAHEMLEPGTDTYSEIVLLFGSGILASSGEIDRSRLGAIVFPNPEQRILLEKILHPRIIATLRDAADRFRLEGKGVLILEIPLLVEINATDMVDKIIVVYAEQATQIERLQNRYQISRDQAVQRIDSQMPLSKKKEIADWLISTEGTLQFTEEQVERVWLEIQKLLAPPK